MRKVGVVREASADETRVALTPEIVRALIADKAISVVGERGLGVRAGYGDEEFESAGAKLVDSRQELLNECQILIGVDGREFFAGEVDGKILISLFDPFFNVTSIKKLCQSRATIISLELIPRISRAQSMDVLSSQANIAGYMAVIMAAAKLNKIMPLMMTAAGTIKPAKVFVLGAGVAGLQAIATAKRLGAMVYAYDVRPVVREQVESLGGKFVEVSLGEAGEGQGGYAKALSEQGQGEQRSQLSKLCADMDVAITTAQIPGQKAPLLLDDSVFSRMKNDALIIDMAASSGGNVPGSEPNRWIKRDRVLLYGADNLARLIPKDASFTFAKNIYALLDLVLSEPLNLEDEILADAVICHERAWVSKIFKKALDG